MPASFTIKHMRPAWGSARRRSRRVRRGLDPLLARPPRGRLTVRAGRSLMAARTVGPERGAGLLAVCLHRARGMQPHRTQTRHTCRIGGYRGADRGGEIPAGRDSMISPRGEVGSGYALPTRSRTPRSSCSLCVERSLRGQRASRLGRGRGAWIVLFQSLDEESKFPCAFDYELHPAADPCKGNMHSIYAMFNGKGSL
jgi:hypothetical protein